jgi:hypothetical protein
MQAKLALLAAALLLSGAAAAQDGGAKVLPIQPNASAAQVQDALQAAGYKDVREVERRGRIFVALARWDSRPVEVRVDGRTGLVADGVHERGVAPRSLDRWIYDRKGPGQHP